MASATASGLPSDSSIICAISSSVTSSPASLTAVATVSTASASASSLCCSSVAASSVPVAASSVSSATNSTCCMISLIASSGKGSGSDAAPVSAIDTPQPGVIRSTGTAAPADCNCTAPVNSTISDAPVSSTRPSTDVPRTEAVAFGNLSVIAPGFSFEILPEINLNVPFFTEAVSANSSLAVGSKINSSNTNVEFGPIEKTV